MEVKTFNLNLCVAPYEAIAYGYKRVEMRLFDERRQQLSVGDYIIFSCNDDPSLKSLKAKIVSLARFKSFKELYEAYPKELIGYKEDEEAHPDDMLIYYSKEAIEKYGALAIEFELI